MSKRDRFAKRMELPLLAGALATVPLVILDVSNARGALGIVDGVGNWVVWILFAVDLVVMLALSENRWEYVKRNPINVFVVILTPPFLPAGLQSARVIRLLRVLRLVRFAPMAKAFFSLQGVTYAVVLTGVALFAGAAAYSSAENRDYATGVYWAIQTLSTVGYGDVSPVTTLGRVVACVLMLVGIGFFAIITGAVAQQFLSNEVADEVHVGEASDAEILQEIAALSAQVQRLENLVRLRTARAD